MRKRASDIVLLPSKATMEAALRLNQILLRRFEKKIVLHPNDCLPHLSLAMGALREEDLPAVAGRLEEIASQFPPVGLTFTEIGAGAIAGGQTVSTWEVEPTAALQSLHETVLNRMRPYLTDDVAAEDFIDFPNVQQTSVDWVNRYPAAAAFERFSPHITLGIGELGPDTSFPTHGTASRLALCHLGDFCTCRKVLFETELRRS